MSKFSVKKPLTVFVAVIAVLVIGVVAYMNMTPDLFPNMDFPYVVIVTAYPGASPEKVEAEVTKPLEQSMSTLEHIVEVSSTSAENYSMVMLEFEESVNMDTIGVDIQQGISALESSWGDMVQTPYVLKINPSILPVEIAAVSMEGMSTIELTEFLDDTLLGKLEGIPGVARITTSGEVRQELHVVLDGDKIAALNDKIAGEINSKLDETKEELSSQLSELESAQSQLEDAKEQLEAGKEELANQTAQGEAELSYQQAQLVATKAEIKDQISQLQSGKTQVQTTVTVLKTLRSGMAELEAQLESLSADLDALLELSERKAQLEALEAELQARIDAIMGSGMTQEEIDAAIEAIRNSAEYKALEAGWAELKAALAAYGLNIEDLETDIAAKQELIESIKNTLDSMFDGTAGEGLDAESIDAMIKEMEDSLVQMDEAVVMLNSALYQVDNGMLQLKDAAAMLSEEKTKGLLEISSAASELNSNSALLSSSLVQLEAGLDTIEDSRETALEQANLEEIITADMISSILTAQNFAMPAGYVSGDGITYMVSVGEEIQELETVQGLLLFDMGMEGIEPIYLTDVAAVMLTDNSNEVYSKLNGENSITLQFEKQSTYSTAEVTDNINERFEELEEEYEGLSFVALMNQGDYIYLIVDSIVNSLLLGALFAVIVLFIFLRDIRPTLITLCSIPISVIFAIVLMYFSGVTINMISLSGLAVAVGMLVDNSVVVIENIYRLRAKGATAIQAAVSGAGQVAGAVTASTLTTVCVFMPIVFVKGLTRQLFTDLALTMTFALLASLIVALTLVPAMASGMLKKQKPQKAFLPGAMKFYGKSVEWSLKHKYIVLPVTLVLLVATGLLAVSRGFEFMPAMDMPNVNVSVSMPEGIEMDEAVELADEVLERIASVEGIATVGASMSTSDTSSMLGGGASYDVSVYITLESEKDSGARVGKAIEEACADLECTVSASSEMMDMSMLTGGSGISMRVYAENMEALQDGVRKAAEVLSGIEGVKEVSDGLEDSAPAIHVDVDRNKAMQKGITVAQVYMDLSSALSTEVTGTSLELSGNTTSVIIDKPEAARLDLEGLRAYVLEVTGKDGTVSQVALGDIAEIRETTGLASISRLNQRRYLSVSASLEEGYNVTLVNAEAEKAMRNADLGEGVSYNFTGENETIMEAVRQLVLTLALGILLVYLVMVAQFQSLKSPFIVMFTIPLAFTGGFIALLLCGMKVSVVSLIGFVMLVGVIVNNGIVLVDYINQLRLEGMACRDAVIEAGKTRLRPILMTTITTVVGLIQMAISQNAGTALMQPVAVVCIGGLVYATLMTLFVVPCIYEMLNKKDLRKVDDKELEMVNM